MMSHRGICLVVLLGLTANAALAEDSQVWRVLPAGELPQDARLEQPRTLRDAYHPWSPPTSREAWEREAEQLRRRILVSNGLWPMPPRPPLEPVIHGMIDRNDYTIERVFFASHPGHYVTGNLYRPKNFEGKRPGVLCPHGHWSDARFYDAGEKAAAQLVEQGGETNSSAARHHIQARAVHLARMGCVVFHYDMVGYSDSRQIPHSGGFTDVEATLRLQNFMGLQTFNSIRALDFLVSLPDVDTTRIGVTGASGGGTQTFLLAAIDPRVSVAFPAVMVSTNMQGGCVCENAEYLRIGCNNIALAALFAPKPLAMSGANDWTVNIETKGLPELKQVYSLFGHPELVVARAYPQYPHNYNQVARQMMYDWFHRHLGLEKHSPLLERDFVPASREELTVFNDEHPLPDDASGAEELRAYLTQVADQQFAELIPEDAGGLDEYRRVVGGAARIMLDEGVPDAEQVTREVTEESLGNGITLVKGFLSRQGSGEQIPALWLRPENYDGSVVIWFDGDGKQHLFDNDQPNAAVQSLLQAGYGVASGDVYLTGEFLKEGESSQYPPVDAKYVGYTFGYNRPVLSQRVRDILSVIAVIRDVANAERVHLVGTGEAGPWVLLTGGLAHSSVQQITADANGFHFGRITEPSDPMLLPGALKYGDLGGLAALAAPIPLHIAGAAETPDAALRPLKAAYQAADANLSIAEPRLRPQDIARRILQESGKPNHED